MRGFVPQHVEGEGLVGVEVGGEPGDFGAERCALAEQA